MIDKSILDAFTSGIPSNEEDLSHNAIAVELAESAILDSMGKEVPDSKYGSYNIVYDSTRKDSYTYVILGIFENDRGGHELCFNEDATKVGFDTGHNIQTFIPSPTLVGYLKACVTRLKRRADMIEDLVVGRYTSDVHYGTEEYLEEEFESFSNQVFQSISEGKRPVQEAFPMKLDFKGRILQYLIEHDGNMDNIHPIH